MLQAAPQPLHTHLQHNHFAQGQRSEGESEPSCPQDLRRPLPQTLHLRPQTTRRCDSQSPHACQLLLLLLWRVLGQLSRVERAGPKWIALLTLASLPRQTTRRGEPSSGAMHVPLVELPPLMTRWKQALVRLSCVRPLRWHEGPQSCRRDRRDGPPAGAASGTQQWHDCARLCESRRRGTLAQCPSPRRRLRAVGASLSRCEAHESEQPQMPKMKKEQLAGQMLATLLQTATDALQLMQLPAPHLARKLLKVHSWSHQRAALRSSGLECCCCCRSGSIQMRRGATGGDESVQL